jgi:hypothetical protein
MHADATLEPKGADACSMTRVAMFALGLIVAACRGGSSGGNHDGGDYDGGGLLGPGGTGGASTDRFEELSHAICDYYRRCCLATGLSIEPLVDCEMALFEDGSDRNLLGRGNVQLVEPAYSQCLNDLRTTTCSLVVERPACIDVFQGTVPDGGECLDAFECARTAQQPAACVRDPGASDDELGICRTLSPAQAGEPCLLSVMVSSGVTYVTSDPDGASPLGYCSLDQGLFCDLSDHVCVQLHPLGAPCDDDTGCELELYCDGTCQTAKPQGSACTEHDECGLAAWCPEGTCRTFTLGDLGICDGDSTDFSAVVHGAAGPRRRCGPTALSIRRTSASRSQRPDRHRHCRA